MRRTALFIQLGNNLIVFWFFLYLNYKPNFVSHMQVIIEEYIKYDIILSL